MKKNKLFQNQNIFTGLAAALIIIYGVNIFLTAGILGPVKSESESIRPANLELTLISSDCEACNAMAGVVPFIKSQNVKIVKERNVSLSGRESGELIAKYGIQNVPALVITGEVSKENAAALWQQIGVTPSGGAVVVKDIPPYYSLAEKKVMGVVEVIILQDSCTGCYDPLTHMQVLNRFGVFIDNVAEYNASSGVGENLALKYNITKVPTIILSPDASVYSSLNLVWPSVGNVESDGWYVFRNVEIMGTYRDIANNTIVNVAL